MYTWMCIKNTATDMRLFYVNGTYLIYIHIYIYIYTYIVLKYFYFIFYIKISFTISIITVLNTLLVY